jgi:hypothetical protein
VKILPVATGFRPEESPGGGFEKKTPAARATGVWNSGGPDQGVTLTLRKPFVGSPSEPSRLKVRYS